MLVVRSQTNDLNAHSNVLNTMSTMTTKNARARRACCDRLKDRNITSIVLQEVNICPSVFNYTVKGRSIHTIGWYGCGGTVGTLVIDGTFSIS